MSRLDEISPEFMGEDRIRLAVDPTSRLETGARVSVLIDYGSVGPTGVTPPIIATASPAGEDGFGAQRQEFEDRRPTVFTFVARVAGQWLVVVRESAHNRWQGRLLVDIVGEEVERQTR